MKRAGPAVIAVILASLIGCYSDASIEPSPPPDPSPSASARPSAPATPTAAPSPTFEPVGTLVPPNAGANELLYRCATVAFPPSALAGLGADELANHPAALALRRFVVEQHELALLPQSGWHFLGETLDTAEFGQLVANPVEPSGSAYFVRFDRNGPVYELSGWGDCLPRRAPPAGLLGLAWWLPDLAPPDPEVRQLSVNVITEGCLNGPDVSFIEPPTIQSDASSIAVSLTMERVDGAFTCQNCSLPLPTTFELVLPEAIGARELLDASTFPARDAATEPWGLGGCGG